ncbi:MAG: GDP-mannose 4,6-dehydratase, partial [Lysobacterales bacterium]
MRTLLVTGGAGFIGGNYVLRSLALDPELRIINLDLLTYAGNLDTLKPLRCNQRHVFIHGDITDAERVNSLLEQ